MPFGFWFIGNYEEVPITKADKAPDKVLESRLFKRSPDLRAENLLHELQKILERRKNGDTGGHILPYPRLG